MIIGVGIDIVKISRIEKLLVNFSDKFESKIFTTKEITASKNKIDIKMKSSFYAKRFAAKEAFSKAVGLGIGRGVNFTDIEIINDKFGKPKIKLTAKAKTNLLKHLNLNNFKIDLSMTDDGGIAQAVVLLSNLG